MRIFDVLKLQVQTFVQKKKRMIKILKSKTFSFFFGMSHQRKGIGPPEVE